MKIYFEAYPSDNRVEELPGLLSLGEDQDDEEGMSHVLEIKDKRKFIRDFKRWTRLVARDAWSVGGDDGFYDYYPGNFDAAREIAKALPEVADDVTFVEDFAIAVRYGVDGQLDGLFITDDEQEALTRVGKILSQKMFWEAHDLSNSMSRFGYWISRPEGALWSCYDHAVGVNKYGELKGIPKDLLPYDQATLDYFKGRDE